MIDRAKAVYNFYQCNGPLIPRSLKLRQGDPLLRFESRSNYRSARFDFKQSFLKKAAFGIIRYQFKSAAVGTFSAVRIPIAECLHVSKSGMRFSTSLIQ